MKKLKISNAYATKRTIVTLIGRLFIIMSIIGNTNTSTTTFSKVCASARRTETLDLKQLKTKWLLKKPSKGFNYILLGDWFLITKITFLMIQHFNFYVSITTVLGL